MKMRDMKSGDIKLNGMKKNRKGDMEEILKIVLWVVVFALLLWGVYTLYRKLIA